MVLISVMYMWLLCSPVMKRNINNIALRKIYSQYWYHNNCEKLLSYFFIVINKKVERVER